MIVFNEEENNKVLKKCADCKFFFCCEKIDMSISNNLNELVYLEFKFAKEMYIKCPLNKFVLNAPKGNQLANLKILKTDKFSHIIYFLKKYKEKNHV